MFQDIRTGNGFDVHRLIENRPLILCNVHIPYQYGLLGHSDADVALHSVSDALLGALALGDIGMHFPDSDDRYLNADSGELLTALLKLPEFDGWRILNIDLTITAQRPKLCPFRDAMRKRLSELCAIDINRVSVKATTTEKLGFTGRGEGIAAFSTVTLAK